MRAISQGCLMLISIRNLLHRYATTCQKIWAHDRSKTVGASEIGNCARQTWFSKNGVSHDPDYKVSWGALLRGIIIEEQFWVPALRSELPEYVKLLYAYPEQKT